MVIDDSVIVAILDWTLVKLFEDANPSENQTAQSYSPEVTAFGENRFCFFWAEPGTQFDNVVRRELLLGEAQGILQNQIDVFSTARLPATYVHAGRGTNSYLMTFVDNSLSNGWIRGCNDATSEILIGQDSRGPYSSTCHFSGDEFIVVYRYGNYRILIKKIASNGTQVTEILSDTLAYCSDLAVFTNVAVATEPSGKILTLYSRNAKSVSRDIDFKVVNSADFSTVDSGKIAVNIGDPSVFYYYEETPVVSYAQNKFAGIHWDLNGIVLDTVTVVGSTANTGNVRIVQGANFRSPTIASNGTFLTVAWKGNLNGNPNSTVEGIRYQIQGGRISFADADTFTFSDAATAVDFTKPELTMSMDSLGSVGLAWVQGSQIRGCVWANRGVRHPVAFWVSQVESVSVMPGDSLTFLRGGVVNITGADSTRDSIRVGPSSANFNGWSQWTSLADAAQLEQNIKGIRNYYQYKSFFYRDPYNLLLTPKVKEVKISWNIKPRFMSIDSVFINGQRNVSVDFNDTLDIYSRIDTIYCNFTVYDGDTGNTISAETGWPVKDQVSLIDTCNFSGRFHLSPVSVSDSVYRCGLTAQDDSGWAAVTRYLYFRTGNDVPQMEFKAVWDSDRDGDKDTIDISGQVAAITIQQEDSIELIYGIQDYNDSDIYGYLFLNEAKSDSVISGVSALEVLHGTSLSVGNDTLLLQVADPDTSLQKMLYVRTNVAPSIDSISFNSVKCTGGGDTVSIVPGIQIQLQVFVDDPNVIYWDTISYQFTTKVFDSVSLDSAFSFMPTLNDSDMRVIITDIFGKSDTAGLYFSYPWYSTNPVENPGYYSARDTLENHLSLIIGSGEVDTVLLPLKNSGNDTLRINSILFQGSDESWIRLGVPYAGIYTYFDSISPSVFFAPIVLPPDSQSILRLIFSADGLSGDGINRDTLFLYTNDLAHQADTIPIRLEYNDLPRIISFSFEYTAGRPYYLGKGAKKMALNYIFPPHAKVGLTFSEPMDSASSFSGIVCYSVFDSSVAGSIVPIPLSHSWSNNYQTLLLEPVYSAPSAYFSGIQPEPGMFIPTDSVAFVLSSDLVDQAVTPSGPNNLDVNLDFVRDMGIDTTVAFRVDSAHFLLSSTQPDVGVTVSGQTSPIVLTFSSPIYPGTIDTSKINNRSLLVTSKYNSYVNPGRQIIFDTVYINGNSAVFIPAKNFFFDDSVFCYYRGITGRDTLGYSVDIDQNGIPSHLFDSVSVEDDYNWFFKTSDNVSQSVYPDSGATGVSISTPIRITFANPLFRGTIDTSLTGNRSLAVTSLYSAGAQLDFDSISINGNTAEFFLDRRLFYMDSVNCLYQGLFTSDSSIYSVDFGTDRYITSDDSVSWFFIVEDLRLLQVSPDSGSANAPIHSPITMQFSGPVSVQIIDTATDEQNNRSFQISSSFSSGNILPIRSISFSSDSTAITIIMVHKFFSNDSVRCRFSGFSRDYNYDPDRRYLPDTLGNVFGEYSWFFTTENTGFYTYPNPYKPGSDPRHRELGGIVFKNLHSLKRDINDVVIKVFNMNTHPVFDSKKSKISIHFVEGDPDQLPEWIWNTRNNEGNLLASGVYFYVIYDTNEDVLLKGKLLIVR